MPEKDEIYSEGKGDGKIVRRRSRRKEKENCSSPIVEKGDWTNLYYCSVDVDVFKFSSHDFVNLYVNFVIIKFDRNCQWKYANYSSCCLTNNV